MPLPLHPAVLVRSGRHLLRDPRLSHRPPAAGRRLLLHAEVLPGGLQVSRMGRRDGGMRVGHDRFSFNLFGW